MSVQISYKKQLALSIILVVITLMAIEGLLRIYDFYTVSCNIMKSGIYKNLDYAEQKQLCDDYRDLAYLNGIDIHYLPNQHSKIINIDNFGLRGHDITQGKPLNTYRIFLVGGSTAFGWGSTSDSTTISGYLQKRFDNLGLHYNIQVINAGIEGAISTQEAYLIKNKLTSFEPDMFIVYDGYNDMATPYEQLTDPSKLATSPQKYILTFSQMIMPWYKTPIIAPSLLDSLIHRNTNETENLKLMADHISERSSLWHDRWKEICELGNEKGFKTVVLLQPFLGTGNKTLVSYEYNSYLSSSGKENVDNYDVFSKGLDGLQNYCTKTADLRDVFNGNSEFLYYDPVHVQDRGNEIIANKIFELISPIVLKDISKLN